MKNKIIKKSDNKIVQSKRLVDDNYNPPLTVSKWVKR